MFKSKRSQLIIMTIVFFILAIISISYIIVKKNYNNGYIDNFITENILMETCKTAVSSNGSYIDNRLNNLSVNLISYCNRFNCYCNLSIYKDPLAPTNLSLLNYTYYNFTLDLFCRNLEYKTNFSC